jgi:hypothetical protein
MSYLTEGSIKKYQEVIMDSNFIYTGKEALSIIYGGIATIIRPGENVKKFFLPHLKKRYPQFLSAINVIPIVEPEIIEPEVINPISDLNEIILSQPLPSIDEITIPTPILEEATSKITEVKKYPYLYKDKLLSSSSDLKLLFKDELQTLALELGLSSEGKKAQLVNRLNTFFLTK